jgi:hypothetical protein
MPPRLEDMIQIASLARRVCGVAGGETMLDQSAFGSASVDDCVRQVHYSAIPFGRKIASPPNGLELSP